MNVHIAVVEVLAATCGVPADLLQDDVELSSVGLDSLALLEVGLAIEKDMGVTVDDGDLASARTLGDLVRLVGQSQAGAH